MSFYLFTFSLYENISFIIVSAETECMYKAFSISGHRKNILKQYKYSMFSSR